MRNWTVPAAALLLTACAANPPRQEAVYEPPALSEQTAAPVSFVAASENVGAARVVPPDPESVAEVVASPGTDQAYSALVCETRERPGSKIKQKICMTQEEFNARQAATDDQLSALRHEQQWRDEIIREAELSGSRPSGFGLGPN